MTFPDPPKQWVAMQPKLRGRDEMYQAAIRLTWTPDTDSYTVAVTVTDGADLDDLRSEVVGVQVGTVDVGWFLRLAVGDVLDLVRRTRNPFDDLT